jgi:hypothetical protein
MNNSCWNRGSPGLVGIASEVRGWWLRIGKNKILVASSKLQVVSKGRVRGLRIDVGRSNQTGLPLNGSPSQKRTVASSKMQVVRRRKKTFFLRAIK